MLEEREAAYIALVMGINRWQAVLRLYKELMALGEFHLLMVLSIVLRLRQPALQGLRMIASLQVPLSFQRKAQV